MAINKTKKSAKKVVEAEGVAHIKATFNNTLITVTDKVGNTVVWGSAGKKRWLLVLKGLAFWFKVLDQDVSLLFQLWLHQVFRLLLYKTLPHFRTMDVVHLRSAGYR